MRYEYICTVCNTEQEKTHKMCEVNTEPCEKCGATPDKLKKQASTFPVSRSWSTWRET